MEAHHRIEHGKDPKPVFAEAEAILDARLRNAVEDAFSHSIHGELVAAKARWLLDRKLAAGDLLQKGITSIARGLQLEPQMAYLYYSLPVLHALRARADLVRWRDPANLVQAALRTAQRGLEINPANAQLRLAAAEASRAKTSAQPWETCAEPAAEARGSRPKVPSSANSRSGRPTAGRCRSRQGICYPGLDLQA